MAVMKVGTFYLEKQCAFLTMGINRDDGSVVLDVKTLSNSGALTSTWKLCPGDINGAEEGEEFEESSLYFQVECTNLHYSHQSSHPTFPKGWCILLAKTVSFPHHGA